MGGRRRVAVRLAGKGTTTAFRVVGAALSLAGCLAGNLLTGCGIAGRQLDVPVTALLAGLTPAVALDMLSAMFSPMDLLFYALAIYQGYRFSVAATEPRT